MCEDMRPIPAGPVSGQYLEAEFLDVDVYSVFLFPSLQAIPQSQRPGLYHLCLGYTVSSGSEEVFISLSVCILIQVDALEGTCP